MRLITLICTLLLFTPSAFAEEDLATLKVGVLLPLTGELSFQGRAQSQALELAKGELDSFFSQLKVPYALDMSLADTESYPPSALKQMERLFKKGCKVFIGPSSTDEVLACKQFIQENDLLVLTPSASSPQLMTLSPHVLQMLPNDQHQTQAIATLMAKEGLHVILTLARGDSWADSYLQAFKESLEKLGGVHFSHIRYNPKTTLFSNQLDYLKQDLERASAEYPSSSITVLLMGFDESALILQQAKAIPQLAQFKWFASETLAANLPSDAQEFSLAVQLRSPQFQIPDYALSRFSLLKDKLRQKESAHFHAYSAAAFDALKLLAHTYPWVGHAPHLKFWKQALEYESFNTLGTTGWLSLSPNGDRQMASYSFWEMEKTEGSIRWISRNRYQKNPSPSSEPMTF